MKLEVAYERTTFPRSPATRGRELKRVNAKYEAHKAESPATRGRELKPLREMMESFDCVARHARA